MKLCKRGLSPEPEGQLPERGLNGEQGLWVHKQDVGPRGWEWVVVGRLCKAERGLCLGQRGCVLNKEFGGELQTEFNVFHTDPFGL